MGTIKQGKMVHVHVHVPVHADKNLISLTNLRIKKKDKQGGRNKLQQKAK